MLKLIVKPKRPDIWLAILATGLSLFGLIMVYNASVVEAYQLFNDKYYFLKLQAVWITIGLILMALTAFVSLSWVKRAAPLVLLGCLLLLIIVLIPGIGSSALGARRWLNLGSFNLQPTELTKLGLSLYLAAWLNQKRPFWLYLLIMALILALIMLQPDLGTAVVIVFISLVVYYVSGIHWFYPLFLGVLVTLAGLGLIFSSSYRKERWLTFFEPNRDPLGSSYHIQQALIAIGSGGLWGLGLGQSLQKFQFLPQVTTDSIFAVIAEELGFIGAGLLLLIFLIFIRRCFSVAQNAVDNFSRLLATGIASWLAIQTVINLSAMLALLPLTGVPLPFISYGGSSLIANLIAVGLLLNISRYQLPAKAKR